MIGLDTFIKKRVNYLTYLEEKWGMKNIKGGITELIRPVLVKP